MTAHFDDEFSINLAQGFNEQMRKLSLREPDSVYSAIIWQFRRNPTYGASNYDADLWLVELESEPTIYVFFRVDLRAKVVVLTNIRRLEEP